jgi:hypothetical protein
MAVVGEAMRAGIRLGQPDPSSDPSSSEPTTAATTATAAATTAAAAMRTTATATPMGCSWCEHQDERLWVSEPVSRAVLSQLSDPVAVLSGSLPPWCPLLLQAAPLVLSHQARARWLACAAFGPSRAVAALQEGAEGPVLARLAGARAAAMAALEGSGGGGGHGSEVEASRLFERVEALEEEQRRVQRGHITAVTAKATLALTHTVDPRAGRNHGRPCTVLAVTGGGAVHVGGLSATIATGVRRDRGAVVLLDHAERILTAFVSCGSGNGGGLTTRTSTAASTTAKRAAAGAAAAGGASGRLG